MVLGLFLSHKQGRNAYTVFMYFVVVSLFLIILIFPIRLNIKGFCSDRDKKIFFSINIYGKIKLFCGFIDFANNRVVLRLKNKTSSLKYKDFIPDKVKTDFISHFNLVEFRSATLLGGEFNENKAIFCVFINAINRTAYKVLSDLLPYLNFRNDVLLLEDTEPSGFVVKIGAITNVIALIEITVKKIYGGIYNYVKRKIKQ